MMGSNLHNGDNENLIVEAIVEALQSGEVVPIILTDDSCSCGYDCYDYDGILYMKSGALISAIKSFSKKIGEKIVVNSSKELGRILKRRGVLDVKIMSNGKHEVSRKLPIQRGNRDRYFCLKKNELFNVVTNEN